MYDFFSHVHTFLELKIHLSLIQLLRVLAKQCDSFTSRKRVESLICMCTVAGCIGEHVKRCWVIFWPFSESARQVVGQTVGLCSGSVQLCVVGSWGYSSRSEVRQQTPNHWVMGVLVTYRYLSKTSRWMLQTSKVTLKFFFSTQSSTKIQWKAFQRA